MPSDGGQASAAETPTVKSVAAEMYEALKGGYPDHVVYGAPADGKTLIDGRFDLRFIAARLLRRFGTTS